MSTPRAYGGMSDSRRPIIAPGAAVQTYFPVTYASAAYDDLAPSLYPQGAKADSRSHGTRGKPDRASFATGFALKARQILYSLSDVIFVGTLAVFAISGSIAVTAALFILFFVEL